MSKSSFFYFGTLSMLLLFACTQAPDSDNTTATEPQQVANDTSATSGENWSIDLGGSKIEWVGTKVSGYHSGPLQIKSGDLQVANGNITGGKFVIDLTTLAVTGPNGSDEASNTKLMAHLKSPDFFDVTNYPTATFEITSVGPYTGTAEPAVEQDANKLEEINKYKVPNPTHTVSGNLTIKNITKNIQFPAKITMTDSSLDALAKFNIDRTAWDIVYAGKPDDLIRKEIHFGIALKATK